jgi:hypothetical protein
VQLAGGAVLNNQAAGAINLTGTDPVPIDHVAGVMTINNAGTVNKTSAGTQTIAEQFHNSGTVNVNAGSLIFAVNGADTGRYNVANGAALELNGGIMDPVDIAGTGSVNFKSGTIRLDNAFSLADAGTVTISGASVQQTAGYAPSRR